MRRATKTTATWFGLTAGLAGMEHGVFEILQGNTPTESVVIPSIGPPCVAEEVWNACEPAMTIIPNFLISGVLATLLGLLVLVWSLAFMGHKRGGLVLILLSILLLLFGGGFFPPLIGLVGGVAGLQIHRPIPEREPGSLLRTSAGLWPWPLVAFLVWVYAQWPIGEFFNDFMQQAMYFGLVLIFISLPLSVFAAYAHDSVSL